jgi:hypothetical protein
MISWLRHRRERLEQVDAEADKLIGDLGVEAYAEARRREHESSDDAMALRWNRIALAVAHKTGKRVGLDTSTRMAMNVDLGPDREPAGARAPTFFKARSGRRLEQHPRPGSTAISDPVYQRGIRFPTLNYERSRDSSLRLVGRNRRRCEYRIAASNDRIAHPQQ